jgi:hypothetical protein
VSGWKVEHIRPHNPGGGRDRWIASRVSSGGHINDVHTFVDPDAAAKYCRRHSIANSRIKRTAVAAIVAIVLSAGAAHAAWHPVFVDSYGRNQMMIGFDTKRACEDAIPSLGQLIAAFSQRHIKDW